MNSDVSCVGGNSSETSLICTAYYSIPDKVASQKNTTLKNLELDRDNFPSQETPILLYGNFNSEDIKAYESLPRMSQFHLENSRLYMFPYPYNYVNNDFKIHENKFGHKFPDKIRDLAESRLFYYVNSIPVENASEIEHLFHHWKSEMDTLVEAVHLAKKGEIHFSVFTPNILMIVLKDAKEKFKNTVLPFELEHLNYEDIINVSNFRISITNAKLIYDIEVPMIEKDSYKLYRLIPWPMKLANLDFFFFVEPIEDFVAIKAHQHTYIPFKEDEIRNCKTSQEKKFCSVPSMMIDLDLPNTCESALISNHRDDFLSVCTVKLIRFSGTIWHRLKNENSWLFTTSQDLINFSCSDKPSVQMTLNNSGWIHLNSSCVAASNGVTLKPFKKHVEAIDLPEPTLFRVNVANKVEGYLKNSKVELEETSVFDFGRKAYLDLGDLKLKGTSLDKINNETYMKCNHIWLWSFFVLLSLLFVGYILYETVIQNKLCNKKSSRLKEEFSRKTFFSNGELIVSGNNPMSVQCQNPITEEHVLNNL